MKTKTTIANQGTGADIRTRLEALAKKQHPDVPAGCEGCVATVQYKRNLFVHQWIRDMQDMTEAEKEAIVWNLENP
jgi:hypothetical protein